jgi:hypothetical protein
MPGSPRQSPERTASAGRGHQAVLCAVNVADPEDIDPPGRRPESDLAPFIAALEPHIHAGQADGVSRAISKITRSTANPCR